MIKSIIYGKDKIKNESRLFGSVNEYYHVYFVREDGHKAPMLFTKHEVATAIDRAKKNPEDIQELHEENLSSMIVTEWQRFQDKIKSLF